jgi:hypothetical protein
MRREHMEITDWEKEDLIDLHIEESKKKTIWEREAIRKKRGEGKRQR